MTALISQCGISFLLSSLISFSRGMFVASPVREISTPTAGLFCPMKTLVSALRSYFVFSRPTYFMVAKLNSG